MGFILHISKRQLPNSMFTMFILLSRHRSLKTLLIVEVYSIRVIYEPSKCPDTPRVSHAVPQLERFRVAFTGNCKREIHVFDIIQNIIIPFTCSIHEFAHRALWLFFPIHSPAAPNRPCKDQAFSAICLQYSTLILFAIVSHINRH